MNWLKEHSVTVFGAGVGLYMLNAPEMGTALHWIVGILVILASILTFIQYGSVAIGWKGAFAYPDLFGPEGESHARTLRLYDWSVQVTRPYVNKTNLYIALVADVFLMAGLLQQGWVVLFGLQFIACVVGYAVITSFLSNYHNIYAFVNGSETA